ncbi:hypothetical protein [uncultured Helicobacter sp.]|uniref:hypothetical protein n=1 Tax=uncultured Helicobacter sp. TaxID=175537 RepID=UPI0026037610|nr:hypothetical protein [uncultured Helicobacter sp.]
MGKKIIGIVLSIGAVVAIGLGVAISFKSKEIKDRMTQTLNQSFEHFANQTDVIESWESFVCSGFISIGCYSKHIALSSREANLHLYDIGIDVHSADDNSLKATFNIKNMKMEVNDLPLTTAQTEEEALIQQKSIKLFTSFVPNKIQCDIALNQNDITLNEKLQCDIKASNATYAIQTEGVYQHENFARQNIAQILQDFYLDMMFNENALSPYQNYQYALRTFSINTKDKGFSKDMYRFYEIQSPLLGISANMDNFASYVNNINVLFVLAANLTLGNIYPDEISQLGKGIESYILGNTHELGFNLSRKNKTEDIFISLENPEQIFPYFFDNYQLEVISR